MTILSKFYQSGSQSKGSMFSFARSLSRTVHTAAMYKGTMKGVVFTGTAAVLWLFFGFSLTTASLLSFAAYLATGGWRFAEVVVRTLPRDLRALYYLIVVKLRIKHLIDTGGSVATVLKENVQRNPHKIAFQLVDGGHMTFQDVDEYSNAVANYLFESGYRKGDVIVVFMENCLEYCPLWLGMAKIGVVGALVNYNLRKTPLAHCIRAAEAKAVIFSSELSEAIKEAKSELPLNTQYYCFGDPRASDAVDCIYLNRFIASSSRCEPPSGFTSKLNERLFYIYTSGTTGLPKAAIVTGNRFFYMSSTTHHFFYMNRDSVIYDTLPLYHTAGGILGVGQALIRGCTVVIRKKFSASNFWSDCVKYDCTVVQYIGEICRYLLATPEKPAERQHRVNLAFGNGLRPQIWVKFKQRFGIGRIGEFYGATEGNANIINIDNTVGAVGFTTRIAPSVYPVTLIKVDESSGEPVRDRNDMCIMCKPGEPGQLVGKVVKGDPLREFDGYVSKEATNKKLCHNVFHKGDTVFLTGDILEMDKYGYMYFKDRTGDTFRWRGENVSTSEVEGVIHNIIKLNDATVYGVEVPGSEGRAGMAAILDENRSIDLQALHRDLVKMLPPYARPLFVRLLQKVDTTGTFKLRKTDYRKEGIDPHVVKDPMFFLDAKAGQYRPLTVDVFDQIKAQQIRF